MRPLSTILALLLLATAAHAVTGTVSAIRLQSITDAELDETIIEDGVLVRRTADPKDLRLGDGITAGGIGLWNYNALTSAPALYHYDLGLGGHAMIWNDMTYNRLTSGAEGPLWYLRNRGSNVLTIVSGRDATRNALVDITDEGSGSNVVIRILNESGTTAPVVEVCEDITNQVWTAATGAITRLSANLVEYRELTPSPTSEAARISRTYRVTAPEVHVQARLYVPLAVPSINLNGDLRTEWPTGSAYDDSWRTGVVYATDAAYITALAQSSSAWGWGDHATAGYLPRAPTNGTSISYGESEISFDDENDMVITLGPLSHLTKNGGVFALVSTPVIAATSTNGVMFYAGAGIDGISIDTFNRRILNVREIELGGEHMTNWPVWRTNAIPPVIIAVTNGGTYAISPGSNAYYSINLSNETQTINLSGFGADASPSLIVDIRGTNSLTMQSDGVSISGWTAGVSLSTNTIRTIWQRYMWNTNWVASQL